MVNMLLYVRLSWPSCTCQCVLFCMGRVTFNVLNSLRIPFRLATQDLQDVAKEHDAYKKRPFILPQGDLVLRQNITTKKVEKNSF